METGPLLDYTKFRPKKPDELRSALAGASRFAVIWCRKCYKPWLEDEEQPCGEVLDMMKEAGEAAGSCTGVDFLCNRDRTSARLAGFDRSKSDTVGVVSCGLGIQLVAELLEGTRVVALADSIPQSGNATSEAGYHGMALRQPKCAACGQCYLADTGGICPIVECAKSLVNGPCGGAKNGKCEVSENLPCAWEEISKRLAGQQRRFAGAVKARDFSVFGPEEKASFTADAARRRREGFAGGVHPLERKAGTEHAPVRAFPEPKRAVVFLSQHTGPAATAVVKPGDRVDAGQAVGEAAAYVSSPVHSPIAGTVTRVGEEFHPVFLAPAPAVVIENDGSGRRRALDPMPGWETADPGALRDRVREAGIVGLGGAMFPAAVKLKPPKPVDALLVNGCECEPILSGDNRVMIESAQDVVTGARILARALGVERAVIAVEENKPGAAAILFALTSAASDVAVTVVRTKYPQGAERMLIKRVLDREVPPGGLPFDVGAAVFNVSTAAAVCAAVRDGAPLIERVVTVAGDGVPGPGNIRVRIGTPFADILKEFAGSPAVPEGCRLVMGGPMMGIAQPAAGGAVIKGTTGLCVLEKPAFEPDDDNDCIRCGRCLDVCPVNLVPAVYAFAGKHGLWKKAAEYDVRSCIECGACEYICSAKIRLTNLIKKAKTHARDNA